MEYIIFWATGQRQGEVIATFYNESDAIKFVSDFYDKNDNIFEPSYGCIDVIDEAGNPVEW